MAPEKIKYKKFIVGKLQANSYILFTDNLGKCLIIDPGDEAHKLTKFIKNIGLKPAGIILTHGHFDHCAVAKGSVGRSDLQESDPNKLKKSLNILKQFPPDTIILPGHGNPSTIKQEIELNPFLKF